MKSYTSAPSVDIVGDARGVEGLVESLYISIGSDSIGQIREEFRGNLIKPEHGVLMVGRRAGAVVGWAEVLDPIAEENTDDHHILFYDDELALRDTEVCRQLIRAAAEHAAPTGVRWIIDDSPAHQRLAAELGAGREELSRIWEVPRESWRSPAGLPSDAVREVPAVLSREELDQYARFYTDATEPRCGEDGSRTVWDADAIAEMLAEDPEQHTFLLTGPAGIRAEVTVDVLGDRAVLWLVPHDATTGDLVTLVGTVLEGVRARYPHVRSARAYLDGDEKRTVSRALAAAGFTATGHEVRYHLTGEPAQ
ncbi:MULTISPECIES: hypothetical protein [unclassified Streptomyces]|uniref:hypothetical protein n=1 Tax=unclassified Streptomyces TaxID=2593676 RepID=UPI003446589D